MSESKAELSYGEMMRAAVERWGLENPCMLACDADTIRTMIRLLFRREVRKPGAPSIRSLGKEGVAWMYDTALGCEDMLLIKNPYHRVLVERVDGKPGPKRFPFAGPSDDNERAKVAREALRTHTSPPSSVQCHVLHKFAPGYNDDWDGRARKGGGDILVAAVIYHEQAIYGEAVAYGYFNDGEVRAGRYPSDRWRICT